MKLQLIETPDYILSVSDEEIKEGDLCYDMDGNPGHNRCKFIVKCLRTAKDSYWNKRTQKIIAHLPKNNTRELDLPLLPEVIVEDDVEKLADTIFGIETKQILHPTHHMRKSWIGGYKSATKVYSEEDLRFALSEAFKASQEGYNITSDEVIESLNQHKTPKWFVAEKEYLSNDGNWKNVLLPSEWEVDTQFRFKTSTINNKTYLVGTYEY